MKKNLFFKKTVGLCASLFFGISGAFAMTHEETHVPPDKHLYECESDIKIFKSVVEYFNAKPATNYDSWFWQR